MRTSTFLPVSTRRRRSPIGWRVGILLGIVCSFAPSFPAAAQEMVLTLDPAKTEIKFSLGATLHTVEGSAALFSGEIRFELGEGQGAGSASGEVVVLAATAKTGNQGRDRNMHRDVLESTKHPRIVFRPQVASGDLSSGTVTVEGKFEIHGRAHSVKWPIQVKREGELIEIAAEFTVPFVAWGLEDPSTFVLRVAKEVEVSFRSIGTLRPVATDVPVEEPDEGDSGE